MLLSQKLVFCLLVQPETHHLCLLLNFLYELQKHREKEWESWFILDYPNLLWNIIAKGDYAERLLCL